MPPREVCLADEPHELNISGTCHATSTASDQGDLHTRIKDMGAGWRVATSVNHLPQPVAEPSSVPAVVDSAKSLPRDHHNSGTQAKNNSRSHRNTGAGPLRPYSTVSRFSTSADSSTSESDSSIIGIHRRRQRGKGGVENVNTGPFHHRAHSPQGLIPASSPQRSHAYTVLPPQESGAPGEPQSRADPL